MSFFLQLKCFFVFYFCEIKDKLKVQCTNYTHNFIILNAVVSILYFFSYHNTFYLKMVLSISLWCRESNSVNWSTHSFDMRNAGLWLVNPIMNFPVTFDHRQNSPCDEGLSCSFGRRLYIWRVPDVGKTTASTVLMLSLSNTRLAWGDSMTRSVHPDKTGEWQDHRGWSCKNATDEHALRNILEGNLQKIFHLILSLRAFQ